MLFWVPFTLVNKIINQSIVAKLLSKPKTAYCWCDSIKQIRVHPESTINNISALVQIMAWCRSGDKPVSKQIITWIINTCMYHWVNVVFSAWNHYRNQCLVIVHYTPSVMIHDRQYTKTFCFFPSNQLLEANNQLHILDPMSGILSYPNLIHVAPQDHPKDIFVNHYSTARCLTWLLLLILKQQNVLLILVSICLNIYI